jgi:hypothetical protein
MNIIQPFTIYKKQIPRSWFTLKPLTYACNPNPLTLCFFSGQVLRNDCNGQRVLVELHPDSRGSFSTKIKEGLP